MRTHSTEKRTWSRAGDAIVEGIDVTGKEEYSGPVHFRNKGYFYKGSKLYFNKFYGGFFLGILVTEIIHYLAQ
jgi:hypothetical protein